LTNPGILPVREVDPSFGPLIPLCRELRTEAGPIDVAFINPFGKLTLVECKTLAQTGGPSEGRCPGPGLTRRQ
jgi:hypothetical protein